MANSSIDTIRVGSTDYEISDPHALYGTHDESAPNLTDNPLYVSDIATTQQNDQTKPAGANVAYEMQQQINTINSDISDINTRTAGYMKNAIMLTDSAKEKVLQLFAAAPNTQVTTGVDNVGSSYAFGYVIAKHNNTYGGVIFMAYFGCFYFEIYANQITSLTSLAYN